MISWCGTCCAVPALFLELHALLHAEAVLFVHDYQRQALKRDAFLEQRVGAHGDVHLAAGHGGDGAAPRASPVANRTAGPP